MGGVEMLGGLGGVVRETLAWALVIIQSVVIVIPGMRKKRGITGIHCPCFMGIVNEGVR